MYSLRVPMAHLRESKLEPGRGIQVEVRTTFQVVASSLGRGHSPIPKHDLLRIYVPPGLSALELCRGRKSIKPKRL